MKQLVPDWWSYTYTEHWLDGEEMIKYQPIAFISSRQLKFKEIRITTIVGVSVPLNQLQLYQLQIIWVTTN